MALDYYTTLKSVTPQLHLFIVDHHDNIEKRFPVMDIHDVTKLSRLWDTEKAPTFSRDDILPTLATYGYMITTRNGISPSLETVFHMHEYLQDMKKHLGLPTDVRPNVHILFACAQAFCAGTHYTRTISEAFGDDILTYLIERRVLSESNHTTTRVGQEALAAHLFDNAMERTREYWKQDDTEITFAIAQNHAIESLILRHSRDFWERHSDRLLDLPTDGEGASAVDLDMDDDFLDHLYDLSEDGLVSLKDGTWIYQTALTKPVTIHAQNNLDLLYGRS